METKKYSKNMEILMNPTWEQQVEKEPLLAFSFILSTRNNQLLTIADEILGLLDDGISEKFIYEPKVTRAGILMWLWSLGAYEVVRTMCQADKCFSPSYIDKLKLLKKELAKIRMPDSKMEKQGKRQPVPSSRSPWCEDVKNKDLWIGDPENASSARKIIDFYATILSSMTAQDVVARHEESYDE
jgi:hypothetical protein